MKITDEEYKLLVNEVANRCKDLVYMKSEKIAKKMLNKIDIGNLLEEDGSTEIDLCYRTTMTVNDLLQIIGRKRRNV